MRSISRQLALLLPIFFTAQVMLAQQIQSKQDRIKAHKVAFITSSLSLTSDEAALFWPVYNEFEDEMMALRNERRREINVNIEELPENEIKQKMLEHFDLENRELQTKRKYHEKFLKVLPAVKVAKLYKAEHQFRRELLRKLQGDRPEHPAPPR